MANSATLTLVKEHHLILRITASMAMLADKMQAGQPPEREMLSGIAEFLQVFVGKCHHEKEDNHLFPLLVQKGVSIPGCPVALLSKEHRISGRLTAELAAAVEGYVKNPPEMMADLITTMQGVVTLYPGHIWRENYLLFPMTDEILNEQEQQKLIEQFEMVENQMGSDAHQRFEKLAEQLSKHAR